MIGGGVRFDAAPLCPQQRKQSFELATRLKSTNSGTPNAIGVQALASSLLNTEFLPCVVDENQRPGATFENETE